MPKAFTHNDKYAQRAQQLGYRARSAFKLEEILQKFPKLLCSNTPSPPLQRGSSALKVLDLGCAPGSWLQVLQKKNPTLLVGVDLQEVDPFDDNTVLHQGDIFSDDIHQILMADGPFDLITSDMAPKTTGIPDNDQWASVELNLEVLQLVESGLLKTGGHCVCKVFQGADFNDFWLPFKQSFKEAKCFKPKSTRDRSVEVFCVGMNKQ